jgi:hypothetical protein
LACPFVWGFCAPFARFFVMTTGKMTNKEETNWYQRKKKLSISYHQSHMSGDIIERKKKIAQLNNKQVQHSKN